MVRALVSIANSKKLDHKWALKGCGSRGTSRRSSRRTSSERILCWDSYNSVHIRFKTRNKRARFLKLMFSVWLLLWSAAPVTMRCLDCARAESLQHTATTHTSSVRDDDDCCEQPLAHSRSTKHADCSTDCKSDCAFNTHGFASAEQVDEALVHLPVAYAPIHLGMDHLIPLTARQHVVVLCYDSGPPRARDLQLRI